MDMPKVFMVLSLWIAKSLVLILGSAFSFQTFVLGNDRVSPTMAAVFVGLLLTIASLTTDSLSQKLGIKLENSNYKKLFLFVEASVIIWVIKLLALATGVGIANIFVVFVVAALVSLIDEPLLEQVKKVKLEG